MCMYIHIQSKLYTVPCRVFLIQLPTTVLLNSCPQLLLSSLPGKYGFAVSDRSTLTLIELLPIYAGVDERDVLSFSVPIVSKKIVLS